MRSLLVCLFLACLTGAAFAAAPPAKVPAEWLKLIDQLGDAAVRKEAEKMLTDLCWMTRSTPRRSRPSATA